MDPINLSEIDGGPLESESSVFWQIEKSLTTFPSKPAVICLHQAVDHLNELQQEAGENASFDCLSLTYSQLNRTAVRLALGLRANGVKPGSKIILILPNGAEYAILLWTCIVAQVTFTSLDQTHFRSSSQDDSGSGDFRSTLTAMEPSAIVFDADFIDPAALETFISPERPSKKPLLVSVSQQTKSNPHTATSAGCISLAQLAKAGDEHASQEPDLLDSARRDQYPERLHSILFTSGTSGLPKGCPLGAGTEGAAHILQSWAWLLHADNSALVLQQAHNARGIAPANTLQAWRAGGAVVMTSGTRGFDLDDLLDAVRRCGVTFVVLTPPMVHGLEARLAQEKASSAGSPWLHDVLGGLGSVKTVQLGGDAVTKDVLLKCGSMFPRADICINHGMTEGGACFQWPFLGRRLESTPYLGQVCPVGQVSPGAVVRIWDADRGSIAERGKAGELHLSSDGIIKGYLMGESPTSFYQQNGRSWFVTGDIAMMNQDGLVYILGRSKDIIKLPCGIVMPFVIESYLERLLDTQACVVATKLSGHDSQVLVAVARSLNKMCEAEILQRIQAELGELYRLDHAVLLEDTGLDEFPVNQTHKIDKAKLAKKIAEYL